MTTCAEALRGLSLPSVPPAPGRDIFSVPAFLARVADGEVPATQVLEALARKVEVARRLHVHYDATLTSALGSATLARDWVPCLGCAFLLAAEHGDLKFLNTALKLQQGVLLQPEFSGHPVMQRVIARLMALPLPS